MKKPIQLNLMKPSPKFFGGKLLKGKRKSLRPLSTKAPIHIVMRSLYAKKEYSFLNPKNRKAIENILGAMGTRFKIRIYKKAIQSNHIHLIVKIEHRSLYKAFIKATSGKIAQKIMRTESFKEFTEKLKAQDRGDGCKEGYKDAYKSKTFWEFRPFTRVVNWGRDYKQSLKYLEQNILEALGFTEYKERRNFYVRHLSTNPDG